jgi:hypothetical protein
LTPIGDGAGDSAFKVVAPLTPDTLSLLDTKAKLQSFSLLKTFIMNFYVLIQIQKPSQCDIKVC